MGTNEKDMTVGSPGKLIITFAIPMMLGNIFQQFYTIVDTMVVGKGLGVNALASLGAADWMNWMMLGIIQGFTQGFGIMMAQEFGGKRMDSLRKALDNSSGSHHNLDNIVVLSADSKAQTNGKVRPCNYNGSLP